MSAVRRFLRDERVAALARIALGVLFVVAATSKLDPIKFAQEVNNYRLLPSAVVNLVAVALPFVELLAGALLIVGLRVRAAALTVLGLLCGFVIAMSWAWAKGIDIQCGCFGKGTRIGFRAIFEDVGMAFLAVEAIVADRGRFGLDGVVARMQRSGEEHA
jgi:uncharacterized membrane protein YphA (DoxX/SURF4 family)